MYTLKTMLQTCGILLLVFLLVLILTPIFNLLPSGFGGGQSDEAGWQAESEILLYK